MNSSKPYILLLILASFFQGCEVTVDAPEENVVLIPEHGYIFFNSNQPISSTRGELISDMNRDFGVMGYNWKYESIEDIWTTKEDGIQPNVFTDNPLQVTYASNLFSYNDNGNGVKEWEAGCKYAFFAYYPFNNSSLVPSSATTYGTPTLTYTMPTDAAKMVDVMTAKVLNTDYTENEGEVQLKFQHRLAALDVEMLNLNDSIVINNDKVPVNVQISELSITLSNQRYEKVVMYMDETKPEIYTEYSEVNPNRSYSITSAVTLPHAYKDSKGKYVYTPKTSGNPLIIIPQKKDDVVDYLHGTINFKVQYVDDENKSIEDLDFEIVPPIEFTVNSDMMAGRKYIIQLTFTYNTATIEIKYPGEWDEYPSEIEFD